MELSIIIPTKNRRDILQNTLRYTYAAVAGTDAEVIIVNDSKTDTIEVDLMTSNKIKVVNNPKSGVASARNFGASHAKANLLLFLDDDMLISQDNIQTTLHLHRQYKKCCINLNWVYPPSLTENISRKPFGRYLIYHEFTSLKGWNRGGHWDDTAIFAVDGITSQYLSMEKDVFKGVNGYNESFPHAGFEDFEFAERLKCKGIRFYIYPLSMVYHNEEDRLQVEAWLQRKIRGGETRRVAVEMGLKNLAISYSLPKIIILRGVVCLKKIMLLIVNNFPNSHFIDAFYFKLVNLLLAAAIFEGYTNKK